MSVVLHHSVYGILFFLFVCLFFSLWDFEIVLSEDQAVSLEEKRE